MLGGFCNNSREWYIEGPRSVWWQQEPRAADARNRAEAVSKGLATSWAQRERKAGEDDSWGMTPRQQRALSLHIAEANQKRNKKPGRCCCASFPMAGCSFAWREFYCLFTLCSTAPPRKGDFFLKLYLFKILRKATSWFDATFLVQPHRPLFPTGTPLEPPWAFRVLPCPLYHPRFLISSSTLAFPLTAQLNSFGCSLTVPTVSEI